MHIHKLFSLTVPENKHPTLSFSPETTSSLALDSTLCGCSLLPSFGEFSPMEDGKPSFVHFSPTRTSTRLISRDRFYHSVSVFVSLSV